jgi:hypothetical protein
MAISEAYRCRFSSTQMGSGLYRSTWEKVHRDSLYDFLYERDYEPWFCNMVNKLMSRRGLKEWVLRLHTGETLSDATPNWPWDKRAELGRQYLQNLAKDFLNWYQEIDQKWVADSYRGLRDEILRRLEIDGYVYRKGELLEPEADVLDVEAESGLLRSLFGDLGLPEEDQTFGFLDLSEKHYVEGRWSDSIGNARKFFEGILQGVAKKHADEAGAADSHVLAGQRPVEVRAYLEASGLLEKKERETLALTRSMACSATQVLTHTWLRRIKPGSCVRSP